MLQGGSWCHEGYQRPETSLGTRYCWVVVGERGDTRQVAGKVCMAHRYQLKKFKVDQGVGSTKKEPVPEKVNFPAGKLRIMKRTCGKYPGIFFT